MLPSAGASRRPTRYSAAAASWTRQRWPEVRSLARFLLGLLLFCGALFSSDGQAQAHPHVWITATSELIYAPDGSVTGVRHAWTFDDMFSAYALQGIETKTKGVYTREELKPLAQTNVESLKEFAYFTFARADGKKYKFDEPVDYYLEYKDSLLTLHFTLPLKVPLKAGQLSLEVFDPAFFIDFQMAKTDPVKLVGAPANCRIALQRPNDGSASAQKLNEQTFMDGGSNANFGMMFANKITVECP
jgi:ABC-type uncharacterized transport system substrate-binding protein